MMKEIVESGEAPRLIHRDRFLMHSQRKTLYGTATSKNGLNKKVNAVETTKTARIRMAKAGNHECS